MVLPDQEKETGAGLVRQSECNKITSGRKTQNGFFGKHNSEPIQLELAAWPVCSRATFFFVSAKALKATAAEAIHSGPIMVDVGDSNPRPPARKAGGEKH